jgi:hypothetical protein
LKETILKWIEPEDHAAFCALLVPILPEARKAASKKAMDTIEELMAEPKIKSTRPAPIELPANTPNTAHQPHPTHYVSAPDTGRESTPVPSQPTMTAPGAPGVHTPNEDGSEASSGKHFTFGSIVSHQHVPQTHMQVLMNGKLTPPLVKGQDELGILGAQLAMTSLNGPATTWQQ